MRPRGENVITQPRSQDDVHRRARDIGALKRDFGWWSFYWSGDHVLTALYMGVGPDRSVTGYSADEVRTKVEQVELNRIDQLVRLRQDFPGLNIWSSVSGKLYAIRTGPQHRPPLIPVLEADTPSELRQLITGSGK